MDYFVDAILPATVFYKITGPIVMMFGLLVWEHFGRRYENNLRTSIPGRQIIRPSIIIGYCAGKSKIFFLECGKMVAWVSSYLAMINLQEIGITLYDFFKPIYDLVVSPLYFIYGYFDMAKTYLTKEWMIYLGTVMIVAFIIYICSGIIPYDPVYFRTIFTKEWTIFVGISIIIFSVSYNLCRY